MAFMIISGIESEVNLRYLELERVLPAEIYAGLSTKVGYLIRNQRNNSSRLLVSDMAHMKVEQVFRDETESFHSAVTFPKRGYAMLGRVTISTTTHTAFSRNPSPFRCTTGLSFSLNQNFYSVFISGVRDTGEGRPGIPFPMCGPIVPAILFHP